MGDADINRSKPYGHVIARLRGSLATMSPGYYSMVMATGIVSLGAWLLHVPWLAWALYVLNWVLFVIMCGLAVARLCWHLRASIADLSDHLEAPGFFTFVAACSILGNQTLLIGGMLWLAVVLGIMALVSWLVLTYAIFTILTTKADKPRLDKGINGGWLLAVVATQALAVLAALLSPHTGQPLREGLNFAALSLWLCGGMLYIWLMSLIFYRYTFFRLSPADLSPPYWINMGAMAISTLAGTMLIDNAAQASFVATLLPFVKGFSIFYWATGTWWIPMLLVLAVWRHGVKRFPFTYDPMYWGAAFPIGMYAVATLRMQRALGLHFLYVLPRVAFVLAVIVWTVLFIGQLRALAHRWASGNASA